MRDGEMELLRKRVKQATGEDESESVVEKVLLGLFSVGVIGVCVYMTFQYGIHFYTLGVVLFGLIAISVARDLWRNTKDFLAFRKNNNINLSEKFMKIAIIFSVIVVALSLAYSFVYRPIQKERTIKQCYEQSGWKENMSKWGQEEAQERYDACLKSRGV